MDPPTRSGTRYSQQPMTPGLGLKRWRQCCGTLPVRERITGLRAYAFRGVPKSFEVLLPRGQSVVVFGENGAGKSTIADMVEFFLTGGIEFLSKEGRSHAIRHIGAAKVVDTAVEVTATGSLGGRLGLPLPKGWSKPIGEGETFLLRGRTLADFLNKS